MMSQPSPHRTAPTGRRPSTTGFAACCGSMPGRSAHWLNESPLADKTRDFAVSRRYSPIRTRYAADTERSIFVLRQYEPLPRRWSPSRPANCSPISPAVRPDGPLAAVHRLRISELCASASTTSTAAPPLTAHHTIEITRKGRKPGYVIAPASLLDETDGYISGLRFAGSSARDAGDAPPTTTLFVNARGAPVSKNAYQRAVSRAGLACGFKATTHLLCATFACMLLARLETRPARGAKVNPLLVVKILLGHGRTSRPPTGTCVPSPSTPASSGRAGHAARGQRRSREFTAPADSADPGHQTAGRNGHAPQPARHDAARLVRQDAHRLLVVAAASRRAPGARPGLLGPYRGAIRIAASPRTGSRYCPSPGSPPNRSPSDRSPTWTARCWFATSSGSTRNAVPTAGSGPSPRRPPSMGHCASCCDGLSGVGPTRSPASITPSSPFPNKAAAQASRARRFPVGSCAPSSRPVRMDRPDAHGPRIGCPSTRRRRRQARHSRLDPRTDRSTPRRNHSRTGARPRPAAISGCRRPFAATAAPSNWLLLYPRAVSLLPYYLAILIHTAGNPEAIADLTRDRLQPPPAR